MRWPDRPVTVSVPATSANLGPGFDSLGLALSLRDRVEVAAVAPEVPLGHGRAIEVEVVGEGAGDVPRGEGHLVVRAVRAGLDALGCRQPALRLRCRNRVPHGRGLGSSAAAIVAGVVVARTLAERADAGAGRVLDDVATLRLAGALEGHPDNVAAALLGGLTVAWTDDDGAHAARLDPAVSAVALVPRDGIATATARGLLPGSVAHRDAAANSGRAALLVAAVTGRPDLLLPATRDVLHQAYREPVMPRTLRLVRALRSAGHAAVVSGAGPAVLVLRAVRPAADPDPADVLAVDEVAAALADGWRAVPLRAEAEGARVDG